MSYSSKEYLLGLRDGSRDIVRDIYKKNLNPVTDWIIKCGGTKEVAQDVFHDALEVLIVQAQDADSPIWNIELEPYLFRICRNKWIDQVRKKKSFDEKVRNDLIHRDDKDTVQQSIMEQGDNEHNLRQILERTMSTISDTCQKLITLMNEGKKGQEVLKQLNMPNMNTYYRRKFACLKRWREILEKDKEYELYIAEYGR